MVVGFIFLLTACTVWAPSQPSPRAGRGQPEHKFLHHAEKLRLNTLSAISDSAGMPGMTRQPHFCTLSKIISLCHQKLFDLLSVQAPNQQKLNHFFLHAQHLHNRCHRRLAVSFARASQTSQRKRGFLFNRKHLKSHKLRAENSKSV